MGQHRRQAGPALGLLIGALTAAIALVPWLLAQGWPPPSTHSGRSAGFLLLGVTDDNGYPAITALLVTPLFSTWLLRATGYRPGGAQGAIWAASVSTAAVHTFAVWQSAQTIMGAEANPQFPEYTAVFARLQILLACISLLVAPALLWLLNCRATLARLTTMLAMMLPLSLWLGQLIAALDTARLLPRGTNYFDLQNMATIACLGIALGMVGWQRPWWSLLWYFGIFWMLVAGTLATAEPNYSGMAFLTSAYNTVLGGLVGCALAGIALGRSRARADSNRPSATTTAAE